MRVRVKARARARVRVSLGLRRAQSGHALDDGHRRELVPVP